jgi:PAS domain S-box-containing protein
MHRSSPLIEAPGRALREVPSDEAVQSVLGLYPMPSWIYDEATQLLVAVNECALTQYGYSREQFLAMSMTALSEAAEATPVMSGTARYRAAAGVIVAAKVESRRITFAGRPAWLQVTVEVTAEIEAARSARSSEQHFRLLFEAGSDWFWETDAKGYHTYVSPNAEANFGLPVAEMLGKRFNDLRDVACTPEMARKAISAIKARAPYNDFVYCWGVRETGRRRWARTNNIPIFDEAGEFRGYRGVGKDITAEIEAEQALRESELHLAHAQRVSGVGSAYHNFENGTDEWSDELYRILGLERGTIATSFERFLDYVHRDDRASVIASNEALVRGEPPPNSEYRIVRDDGSVRVVHSDLEPIYGDDGWMKQLLVTFHDVTELRAAEARQRDLEEQLQHTRKLEALGTLAGGVAHDLNNTLVPILSLSKLTMRRLPEDSRDRANLAAILKAGERARDLVKQILAFCRKEAPTRARIDLAALIRDSLGMVRASLPATIHIDEAIDDVPPLLGDPGQLHQILLNLVVNAAQAIGDKMGTLSVALHAGRYALPVGSGIDVEMPGVQLSVSDTGRGMDEATRRRIFEPFFTTKAIGEGTGLGLSVVHSIIAQHGGRIEVESRIGEGTRFDVYLPTLPDETEQPRRELVNLLPGIADSTRLSDR